MVLKRRKPKRERSTKIPFLEGPGKGDYVRRLGWLIDFANTETLKLSPPDFLSVMDKCLSFFYEEEYNTGKHFNNVCADTELNRGAVEHIRYRTRFFLTAILLVHREPAPSGSAQELSNFQLSYNLRFEDNRISRRLPKRANPYQLKGMSILADHDGNIAIDAGPALHQWSEISEKTSLLDSYKDDEEYALKYAFFSKFFDSDVYTTVVLSLVPLLERFSLEAIGECPECEKFFKTTRRKETRLCQRCQRKKTTYRWREEHREVYNAYQRELHRGRKPSIQEIRARLAREKESKEG